MFAFFYTKPTCKGILPQQLGKFCRKQLGQTPHSMKQEFPSKYHRLFSTSFHKDKNITSSLRMSENNPSFKLLVR